MEVISELGLLGSGARTSLGKSAVGTVTESVGMIRSAPFCLRSHD